MMRVLIFVLLSTISVGAQTLTPPVGDEFVVVIVADLDNNDAALSVPIIDWTLAHKTDWNIKAVAAVGDYNGSGHDNCSAMTVGGANPSCLYPSSYSLMAGYIASLNAACIPWMFSPGNHDDDWWRRLTSPDMTNLWGTWNSGYPGSVQGFGSLTGAPCGAWQSTYPLPGTYQTDFYLPIQSGATKIGILGLDYFPDMTAGAAPDPFASGVNKRAWAQSIYDANPDRQFLQVEHMLVNHDGSAGGSLCGPLSGAGAGCYGAAPPVDGPTQWAQWISPNPRILWGVNGHDQATAQELLPAPVNSAGTPVHLWLAGSAAGPSGWIMKFRPSAGKVEVDRVEFSGGNAVITNSNWGTGGQQIWDWTPLSPSTHTAVSGRVSFSGGAKAK